ncbi:MAG TPA: FosX/FosE/FosI family fosfomycin resistance hydrolase [Gammaproteobacteria bacterium]|nr:FosX/FosE/FosI family fosfomycin resistance hydrolase [Gammaproteobacteria bacterium]
MKIQGLSHMTFICKDLNKMANLLKTIFNAQEIYSSDNKNHSLSKEKFFNINNIWIAIMEGEAVHKTYNHIAFKVNDEDLDMFKAKILSLGLEILPGRTRDKAEGNSLYFYDYDNHLFELHSGDLDTRLNYYSK